MDIPSAKQNARNKHKASQHKKRNHSHPAKHGKAKKMPSGPPVGPQRTTLDQFIPLEKDDAPVDSYLRLDDVSRTTDDPLSKNFLHLVASGGFLLFFAFVCVLILYSLKEPSVARS